MLNIIVKMKYMAVFVKRLSQVPLMILAFLNKNTVSM